jgi:hypothetical protein
VCPKIDWNDSPPDWDRECRDVRDVPSSLSKTAIRRR